INKYLKKRFYLFERVREESRSRAGAEGAGEAGSLRAELDVRTSGRDRARSRSRCPPAGASQAPPTQAAGAGSSARATGRTAVAGRGPGLCCAQSWYCRETWVVASFAARGTTCFHWRPTGRIQGYELEALLPTGQSARAPVWCSLAAQVSGPPLCRPVSHLPACQWPWAQDTDIRLLPCTAPRPAVGHTGTPRRGRGLEGTLLCCPRSQATLTWAQRAFTGAPAAEVTTDVLVPRSPLFTTCRRGSSPLSGRHHHLPFTDGETEAQRSAVGLKCRARDSCPAAAPGASAAPLAPSEPEPALASSRPCIRLQPPPLWGGACGPEGTRGGSAGVGAAGARGWRWAWGGARGVEVGVRGVGVRVGGARGGGGGACGWRRGRGVRGGGVGRVGVGARAGGVRGLPRGPAAPGQHSARWEKDSKRAEKGTAGPGRAFAGPTEPTHGPLGRRVREGRPQAPRSAAPSAGSPARAGPCGTASRPSSSASCGGPRRDYTSQKATRSRVSSGACGPARGERARLPAAGTTCPREQRGDRGGRGFERRVSRPRRGCVGCDGCGRRRRAGQGSGPGGRGWRGGRWGPCPRGDDGQGGGDRADRPQAGQDGDQEECGGSHGPAAGAEGHAGHAAPASDASDAKAREQRRAGPPPTSSSKEAPEAKDPSRKRPELPRVPSAPRITTFPPVPVTCDAVRNKCREMLTAALQTDHDHMAVGADCEGLSAQIEECIFRDVGNTDMKYKNRVRSRISNLKDAKNPDLRRNVLCGVITPQQIAVMTSEEMASDELKEIRKAMTKEAIREHQMARTGGTQTDLFTCGRCRRKNCTYTQVQTRSSDEPMTTFVVCNECGNRWKFCCAPALRREMQVSDRVRSIAKDVALACKTSETVPRPA
uniref:Opioid related nociceptin receptor 1 n=1 Tax=Canis lupus familiaris TaxID=9615 RepID=A0A8C0RRT6_CANLF